MKEFAIRNPFLFGILVILAAVLIDGTLVLDIVETRPDGMQMVRKFTKGISR